MNSEKFRREAPPCVGAHVRINTGQFQGYTGAVTKVDEQAQAVWFTITVFERPVELSLPYDTAVEILDVLPRAIG